jgi:hypothetical protein
MKKIAGVTSSILLASLVGLAGCGGAGEATSPNPTAANPVSAAPVVPGPVTPNPVSPDPTASDFTLSGTVATGAAFDGASLKITDQTGAQVCSVTVSANGSYSCTIPTAAKAPFVITASREGEVLVSTAAQIKSETINVTPLTTVLAAQLSSSGDPQKLADELKANAALFDQAKLQQKLDALVTLIKPLSDAAGSSSNLLTGSFVSNGTGHDRVLDSLQVSVRPDGTGSNIEITVKAAQAALSAEPTAVSFRSDAAANSALPNVSGANLPVEGTPILVSDLASRLQACYAVPAPDRVTTVVDTAVPSTSTVKSDTCKSVFLNSDPIAYKHNSFVVGSGRGVNAFSGMFRNSATGVKFDRANLEYLLPGGDMAITYRWTDSFGNTDNDQVIARKVGSKLYLVGNQYQYDANVRALVQNREYLNTPNYNHVSTGYNIAIKNRTDTNGIAIFSRVEVISPRGNLTTYVPVIGRTNMSIFVPASGSIAAKTYNTSVIRLAAKYANPLTLGNIAEKETNLFFRANQMSDDEIRSLPDHGVWSLRFVHVDATVADVVQYYKTTSRAPTLAEAKYMSFANLSNQLRDDFAAKSAQSGTVAWLNAPTPGTPNRAVIVASNNGDGWVVPSGALAPTGVTIYGRMKDNLDANGVFVSRGAAFDDGVSVLTNNRKVTINCSRTGSLDLHCDSTDPTQFVQGAYFNAVELFAKSSKQVEVSKMVAIYKIQ